jgi:hypothetical protein
MISSIGSGASSGQAAAMAQMRSQIFKKSDADASGGLDATEFRALVANGPGGAQDAASVETDFKAFDSNSDGSLTQAELDAGVEQKMQAFRSTMDLFGGVEGSEGPRGPGGPPPGPPPAERVADDSEGSTSSSDEADPLATLLAALESDSAGATRVASALRELLRGLTESTGGSAGASASSGQTMSVSA